MAILKPQERSETPRAPEFIAPIDVEASTSEVEISMRPGALPDVEDLIGGTGESSMADRRPVMFLLAMVALSRPTESERLRHQRRAALGGA